MERELLKHVGGYSSMQPYSGLRLHCPPRVMLTLTPLGRTVPDTHHQLYPISASIHPYPSLSSLFFTGSHMPPPQVGVCFFPFSTSRFSSLQLTNQILSLLQYLLSLRRRIRLLFVSDMKHGILAPGAAVAQPQRLCLVPIFFISLR